MGEYHLQRHPRPFHAGFYYVIHLLEMHKKKKSFCGSPCLGFPQSYIV